MKSSPQKSSLGNFLDRTQNLVKNTRDRKQSTQTN